jgi:hypothetical protein
MRLELNIGDAVHRAIDRLEKEDSACTGLLKAFERAEAVVHQVPATNTNLFMTMLTPESLGSNTVRGTGQLFQHVEQMLSLMYHTGCYRLAEILPGVLNSLSGTQYTTSCLLARSLFEHAAMAQWQRRELSPLLDALNKLDPQGLAERLRSGRDTQSIFAAVLPVIALLQNQYEAGRFNRDALKRMDELVSIELARQHPHRQVGVMDAVDACDWRGPLWAATTPRFYYELLSDYVHPNFGSNVLYVETEEERDVAEQVSDARNRIRRAVTRQRPTGESLLLHVLQLVYIPIRESCEALSDALTWMSSEHRRSVTFCRQLKRYGVQPLLSSAPSTHSDGCAKES